MHPQEMTNHTGRLAHTNPSPQFRTHALPSDITQFVNVDYEDLERRALQWAKEQFALDMGVDISRVQQSHRIHDEVVFVIAPE
jgi:hypothetical protein